MMKPVFNGCAALVVETVGLLSNNIISKTKTNFIFQDVTDSCFKAAVFFLLLSLFYTQ